jgi:ABC-type Mn2+/Zn2+ transport system permease subunit
MAEPSFFQALSETPMLQRAMVAGGMAGLCCALLSPLVVLRRMAFVGDGIAHAAFGGIGVALFTMTNAGYDDLSVRLVTILFCLALGLAIGIVSRRSETGKLAEDSAIGIAFSVSMALGALLIALRQRHSPQYVPPMDYYLFGSLLNISFNDVLFLAGVVATVAIVLLIYRKEMIFYTFDPRLAEVSGLSVGAFHYAFILLLVLTVVMASRVMGIVLVSASLVIPGVAALRLCNRLLPAMLLSAVLGVLSFEFGLAASYMLGSGVLPGSTIVLTQFALLILAIVCRGLQKRHA